MIIQVPSFSFRLEIIILVGVVGTFLFFYTLRSCCRYSIREFVDQIMDAIMPIEKDDHDDDDEKNNEDDRPMEIMWYTP